MIDEYIAWNSVTTALSSPMSGCTTSSSTSTVKTMQQILAPAIRSIEIIGWGYLVPTIPTGTLQVELIDTGTVAATCTLANIGSWTNPPGPGTTAQVGLVQYLSIGSPSAGTYTITFNGQTTSSIAYNAIASTVASDLAALSSVGTGNVTVTGSGTSGSPFVITFSGALTTPLPAISVTSSLTGGTVVISTPQTGYNASAEGTITSTRLLHQSAAPTDFHFLFPLDDRPQVTNGDIARVRATSSVASVQLLTYIVFR